ncbi:MAG: hypothetical protein PUC41_08810 [Oscillospiraceae bacterium]|jgi:predicted transcriptional regulator|nr:hypothetical protein [Oscillospiraceae bacterium]
MKKVLNDTDSYLAYKLCVEYRKSQAKVAAFLGVGQSTISRIIHSQLQMQKELSQEQKTLVSQAEGEEGLK